MLSPMYILIYFWVAVSVRSFCTPVVYLVTKIAYDRFEGAP